MNATLQTIITGNITEANKLIYSTAVVILEMTGYKMYTNYKGQQTVPDLRQWRLPNNG